MQSPTHAFSEAYGGVLVTPSSSTTDALAGVGVRDASAGTAAKLSSMPVVSRGWTAMSTFFKAGQVSIGLGRGLASDIFNDGLTGFERLR